MDDNQKKKIFFELAVKIKLTFPINHPARNALISNLYNTCNEK